jgi:hypothetical protein
MSGKRVTAVDSANRYHSFRRGWAHAAAARSRDEAFTTHGDAGIRKAYEDGFARGALDRQRTSDRASKLYRYTPSVLR